MCWRDIHIYLSAEGISSNAVEVKMVVKMRVAAACRLLEAFVNLCKI